MQWLQPYSTDAKVLVLHSKSPNNCGLIACTLLTVTNGSTQSCPINEPIGLYSSARSQEQHSSRSIIVVVGEQAVVSHLSLAEAEQISLSRAEFSSSKSTSSTVSPFLSCLVTGRFLTHPVAPMRLPCIYQFWLFSHSVVVMAAGTMYHEKNCVLQYASGHALQNPVCNKMCHKG